MDKRKILRKKIIRRFIEAVEEIALSEGNDSLTIRNIAARAGYKSSTLYNYFQGYDHLLFFVAMKNIRDYAQAAQRELKNSRDCLDSLLILLECFSSQAFEKPEIYETIFLSPLNGDFEDYIQEYYEVFPEDLIQGEISINTTLLRSQVDYSLKPCLLDGYFLEKDLTTLDSMIMLLFEGLLIRVLRGQLEKHRAKEDFMDHAKTLISHFLQRDYDFRE